MADIYEKLGECAVPGVLPNGSFLVVTDPDQEDAVEMTPAQLAQWLKTRDSRDAE